MRPDQLIGEKQGRLSAALMQNFAKVRSVADREFIDLIDTETEKLRNWRARTAGIGQVKAGKSTYLSALIGNPGFLPSEVNPWTAVITNLFFGHPDDPKEGGVFHFFAEDDWLRIIEGDTKTRELAQDLLPGFDPETLRKQVETMRTRAKERLGTFYAVLLGGTHKYDRITRDMLDRYVCAGGEFESSAQRTGRYSDITERADIYMPDGRWAIPAVVTDTPGVNDPFLVRDEFTCRSLLNSDIFLLMLSTHQALTDVDTALVRMVSEHPDKQLMVVVNRIDELDGFAEAAPKVLEDVSNRISVLTSGAHVDVIPASAHWAELFYNEAENTELLAEIANSDEMDRYLRNHHGASPSDPAEKLWIASGLSAVSEAIDRAINEGAGHRILKDQSQALSSLITSIRGQLDISRKNAVLAKAGVHSDESAIEAAQEAIESHAKEAEDLAEELSEKFTHTRLARDALVDNSWRSARRELDLLVTGYIDSQSEDLRRIIAGQQSDETYELDTNTLRLQLEEQALDSYMVARENLDMFLANATEEIKQVTSRMFGEHTFDANLSALPHDRVLPMVAETSNKLTLDLVTSRGWRFWSDARLNETEALQALKEIIRSEFYSSVESMSALVHEALVERAHEALRRMEDMNTAMIEAAKTRAHDIAPPEAEFNRDELLEKLDQAITQIDEKFAVLSEVEAGLSGLTDSVQTTVAESA